MPCRELAGRGSPRCRRRLNILNAQPELGSRKPRHSAVQCSAEGPCNVIRLRDSSASRADVVYGKTPFMGSIRVDGLPQSTFFAQRPASGGEVREERAVGMPR